MVALARLGEFIQQNTLGPCRLATSGEILLTGLQAIDGVLTLPNDRILVKDQSNLGQNGVYIAGASDWVRAPDWNESSDVVTGTLIAVYEGQGEGIYQGFFTGTLQVGTTETVFLKYENTSLQPAIDGLDARIDDLDVRMLSTEQSIPPLGARVDQLEIWDENDWDASGDSTLLSFRQRDFGDVSASETPGSIIVERDTTGSSINALYVVAPDGVPQPLDVLTSHQVAVAIAAAQLSGSGGITDTDHAAAFNADVP